MVANKIVWINCTKHANEGRKFIPEQQQCKLLNE